MIRFIFIFFFILCLAAPSFAVNLVLTIDDCDYLSPHVPDNDVTYKPGLDADGNAVEPADLNDNAIQLPEKITIPLTLQLDNKVFDHNPGSDKLGYLEGEAGLGALTYNTETKQLFYQGKLISDGNRQSIMEACDKIQKGSDKPRLDLPTPVEK